jgi:general stress protein YciG
MKTQNQNSSNVGKDSKGAQTANTSNDNASQEKTVQTAKETFTEESYERLKEGARKGGANSHGNGDIPVGYVTPGQNGIRVEEGINTPGGETFSQESYEKLKEGARKGGENSHKNTNGNTEQTAAPQPANNAPAQERDEPTFTPESKERQIEGARKGGENSHKNTQR